MTDKLKHLMELNHIKSMKVQTATNEELEEAVLELAQNQADLEDAICELAEMMTEVE